MALSADRLALAIENALNIEIDGQLHRSTIAQRIASAVVNEIRNNAEVIGVTSGEHVLPVTGRVE